MRMELEARNSKFEVRAMIFGGLLKPVRPRAGLGSLA